MLKQRSDFKKWLTGIMKESSESNLIDLKKEVRFLTKPGSGLQIAQIRHIQFRKWIIDCVKNKRWHALINPKTSRLNRSVIVKENRFSSTAQLRQNPGIKLDLEVLEEVLAETGIIRTKTKRHKGINKANRVKGRKENAAQEKIIHRLKAENDDLKQKLSEYEEDNKNLLKFRQKNDIIYEILVETGRVPHP